MGFGLRASAESVVAMIPHEVFLAVQMAGPVAAWALVDGRTGQGVLHNWGLISSSPQTSSADQYRRISREIAGLHPALTAMAVDLPEGHQIGVGYSGPGGALGGLCDLMRDDDHMSFLSSTTSGNLKGLGAQALQLCDELLRASGSTHLLVATDGSVDRGHRGAGAGWVTSWGAFGCSQVDTADILLAELEAIASALENVPRVVTRVSVRSDSRSAIAIVVQVLQVGPTAGPIRIPARGHSAAIRIAEAARRFQIRMDWVRAHQGDPMNETADRLAVLARRSIRAALTPDAVSAMANGIVEDHRDAMRHEPCQAAA